MSSGNARSSGQHEETEAVEVHVPCPDEAGCGSSDAATLYSDGHVFCFACSKRFAPAKAATSVPRTSKKKTTAADPSVAQVLAGCKVVPIRTRKLTAATCARFEYVVRQNIKGEYERIAVYRNSIGQPVYLKVRNTGTDGTKKDFYSIGDNHDAELYGQHLCGSGRKLLIVTEGEDDCHAVSQVFDHRYAVVSVPNGAAEAHKAIAKHLQWINTFDKVVLCFDMDEPGRLASQKTAQLLPPGKAFVAILQGKDANELLINGKEVELQQAIYNARPYRPDGVVDARDLTERCLNPVVTGLPWPWPFLTEWTYGRRDGEVYVWGGGTGIGKTDFLAEVIASTLTGVTHGGQAYTPEGFGCFVYETGPVQLKKAIAGKIAHRRFHIPQREDEVRTWTDEELRAVLRDMDQMYWGRGGRLFINDARGACDWDALKDRVRFLVHSEGIKHVAIDPLSALVLQAEDERRFLDALIMQAAQLAQELQIKIYIASHLTRPDNGSSHEEGGHVALRHFRGSNGIVMFTDYVIGLERDQQADDVSERCKTVVRCLKDRYTGNSVGMTKALYYDTLTGMLDVPYSPDNILE